jgi:hypothetical protein
VCVCVDSRRLKSIFTRECAFGFVFVETRLYVCVFVKDGYACVCVCVCFFYVWEWVIGWLKMIT